jgi:hypothetical protein
VNVGGTDRQAIVPPELGAELVTVLTREHAALLKHMETTHTLMLTRLEKRVQGVPGFSSGLASPGAMSDLLTMPELPAAARQPTGFSAYPEPKEDQAFRTPVPPSRDSISVQTASTQTSPGPAMVADTTPVVVQPIQPHVKHSTSHTSITGEDSAHPGAPVDKSKTQTTEGVKYASRNKQFAHIVNSRRKEGQDPSSLMARLERIVLGPVFETVMASLIMVNALIMAGEAQFHGIENGFKIKYRGSRRSAINTWPGAQEAFQALEVTFGVVFILELCIKVLVLRGHFVRSLWNWLDTLIVGGWTLEACFNFNTFLNPMMLRLFRLVKLLRVAKLFKTFRAFDSLSILMSSLWASVSVLFWSIIVLFTVQLAAALLFFQLLEDNILKADAVNSLGNHELYEYFGSFTRSFLTMLELTLGNWAPVCRILTEVSEYYGILVVAYVLLVSFAVVKVITAVFIFETHKVASSDEDLLILQQGRQTARLESNFAGVFKEIDDSGDGLVTWDEFEQIIHDQRVLTWLAALDLDVHQCESLFWLLDDGDGKISFQEFVEGVHRLKGTARSVDLITMAKQQTDMLKSVDRLEAMMKRFQV